MVGRRKAAGVVWVPDVRRHRTSGCEGTKCSYQMFVVGSVGIVMGAVKVVHVEKWCKIDQ